MKTLVLGLAVTTMLGQTACLPVTNSNVYLHADTPLGPYSGSVLSGNFCFVSGKIGSRDGDFETEVSTALDAVEQELGRAGLSLAELVHVTVYLTDIDNYAAFNEIYTARVPEPYPARAVVEVVALLGGARVEIQSIARRH
ncbi:MAG: RidA family protein [Planctomycetota bacterium]|jgi:2-iminobutanoate/2-iminopropanoate deaminase